MLSAVVAFAPFALMFSSGLGIGATLTLATTDWEMVGKAAKACNIITRQLCYQHCVFMSMETDFTFWEEMSKKFM